MEKKRVEGRESKGKEGNRDREERKQSRTGAVSPPAMVGVLEA